MQTGTTASLMSRAGAGLALLLALVQAGFAYESGRAGFTVAVNADLVVSYRVFTLYVLPGEELDLTAGDQSATATRPTWPRRR
jgi:hypothetical protein